MDLTITGRHVEVTDAMERHIREHVDRLPRFDNQIHHITVTLANDSSGQQVELIARCHKSTLVAKVRGHDMYRSIEEAFSKLERRVARLHGKLLSKHSRRSRQASRFVNEPEQ